MANQIGYEIVTGETFVDRLAFTYAEGKWNSFINGFSSTDYFVLNADSYILSLEHISKSVEYYIFSDGSDKQKALADATQGVMEALSYISGAFPVTDPVSMVFSIGAVCLEEGSDILYNHVQEIEQLTQEVDDILNNRIKPEKTWDDWEKELDQLGLKGTIIGSIIGFLKGIEVTFPDEDKKPDNYNQCLEQFEKKYTRFNSCVSVIRTFVNSNKGNKNNKNLFAVSSENNEQNNTWTSEITNITKRKAGSLYIAATQASESVDPLVIDLGKKGIELTSLDDGVYFDLDNNGFAERTAWIGGEDGFLALDRNGNGKIDNGGELFGDQVTLKDGSTSSEGFEALAELDENGDGVIDKNDSEFKNLRVWIDANHNGVSESDELKTLDELGITSISLDHANKSETDSSTGTIVSESSTVTFADGTVRDISEHWFKVNSADSMDLNDFGEGVVVSSVDSFGNVMSLNNAIFADKTGTLAGLVEQFKNSTDYIEKRILVKRILYFITDSAEISTNSRGSAMDARNLHVIERFMGRGFVGIDGGTSPNANAAAILKEVYLNIEKMYLNLLNKETVIGDYLDLISKRWGGNGTYLDTSLFKETISHMAENGQDVENIIAGVASWLSQYDDVNSDTTFDDLKTYLSEYGEIFDRIKNTNTILGGADNDVINGTNGVDLIFGDDGNDELYGNYGDDVLDGGDGDDYLSGGEDNDTYIYGKGSGNDTIYDRYGTNRVKFVDLMPDDLTAYYPTSGYDAVLIVASTGETLTFKDFRYSGSYRNFNLEFADGTTLKVNETGSPFLHIVGTNADDKNLISYFTNSIIEGLDGSDTLKGANGVDMIYGGAGNDSLYGNYGNDILDGGDGDDYLSGGEDNDTYIYGKGSGNDTIYDCYGMNRIKFVDLMPDDLTAYYPTSGYDAVLIVASTGETLTFKNFRYSGSYRNFELEFNNGRTGFVNYERGEIELYPLPDDTDETTETKEKPIAIDEIKTEEQTTATDIIENAAPITPTDDDIVQSGADILDELYADDNSVSELLTESDNTVISEIADSASTSDENENTADQIDVQVMILTENMAAFSNESNISDSMNMQSGTDSLAFADQLLVGTQAS